MNSEFPWHEERPPLRLKLENFKPLTRDTLRGFAFIVIEPIGPTIDDVTIYQADNGTIYALLPSKPQLRSDGTVVRRDDGRVAYSPILKFGGRDAQERFSHGVIELVRRRYSEALL